MVRGHEERVRGRKGLVDRVEGPVGERIGLVDEPQEAGGPLRREARLSRVDQEELVRRLVDLRLVDQEEVPVSPGEGEEIRARQEIDEPLRLLEEDLGAAARCAEGLLVGRRKRKRGPKSCDEPIQPRFVKTTFHEVA